MESRGDNQNDVNLNEELMKMWESANAQRNLPDLAVAVSTRLRPIVPFEAFMFGLHDSERDAMRFHLWEVGEPFPPAREIPMSGTLAGWCMENQQEFVAPRAEEVSKFPFWQEEVARLGINSYCILPLTGQKRRLGAWGVASKSADRYTVREVDLLKKFARIVAAFTENLLAADILRKEQERINLILDTSRALSAGTVTEQFLANLSEAIRKTMQPEFVQLALHEPSSHSFQFYSVGSPIAQMLLDKAEALPVEKSLSRFAFHSGKSRVLGREDLKASGMGGPFLASNGLISVCSVPLIARQRTIGVLNLGSKHEQAFSPRDIAIIEHIANLLALRLDSASNTLTVSTQTETKRESAHPVPGLAACPGFQDIIGESPVLKRALDQVKIVAPVYTTVLILGETGTGKELIARALHRLSSRSAAPFIKLNCAAIPTGLLESELFGHEKGAFTGAVSQKVGRLELADKGTLFLDEVGDIPLELQPKLLRVLQDQEFERLGGTRTIRVNIRLVAATNRDLARAVAEHEFRSDLYYRLNVFPITTPSLRERGADIELLTRYFVEKYSRLMRKCVTTIPSQVLEALGKWSWPGNVRELENFIERSVILSDGEFLNAPIGQLKAVNLDDNSTIEGTLDCMEREHILRALRESGGVIAGMHGAAARLGLKRTTLQSRLVKMGIHRADYEN